MLIIVIAFLQHRSFYTVNAHTYSPARLYAYGEIREP